MAEVRLEGVTRRFGSVAAVQRLTLHVYDGELVALLGPSGCGKTTTLRCIGGFIEPDEGEIYFGSRRMTHLDPEHRNIGMVFQNYALFPHMTVFDNVAFGLRMRRSPPADVRRRVQAILKRVQLNGMEDRYPRQLSGGQQQRVALARALVCEPEVLLLDEPLANLDAKLREEMRFYVRSLQKEVGITTIYVTHDQAEAMVIADRIGVMFDGVVHQLGTPEEVYQTPATQMVADFIGLTNFLPGRVVDVIDGVNLVDTAAGRIRCRGRVAASPLQKISRDLPVVPGHRKVLVAVRPEALRLSGVADEPGGENLLKGTVRARAYLGNFFDYRVELTSGDILRVQGQVNRPFTVGDRVQVTFPVEDAWVIPAENGNSRRPGGP